MKIALITDTHFGARNDNDNFNSYFYKFWDNTFFPYIQENNIDTVIHLGDVMDRRKFVSYKIAKDFREKFIQRFIDLNINLHMLVGNHDTFYKNTNDVNSLDELVNGKSDKIKIYSECQTVEFDGLPLFFIPWINVENYNNTVKQMKETNAQVCFGHLEINGFEMHKGQFSENGYPRDMFQMFDTVFSGHFHKKSDDGHIFYLGTTYQITWADYQDPKGFHVFDTETRNLTRIENPYTIYHKVYYDDTTNDYDKFDFTQLNEKYVKVIVVNKKDLYKFDRFIDTCLTKAGTYEVKIVEDFSDLSAENVSDEIVENAEDTTTLLEKYIEELDVDIDKKRLTSMMKSLYVEASDLEL
jgi:DNA repair exonuclease SbcCD nuclease subunit